jgi:SAM-dependent methyltransferase
MSWTSGYFTELSYTFGYYREMNPLALRLACLCNGVDANLPETPTYLELGFGHGVSLNIHAAASRGYFWGTDFNPAQVANAYQLADASKAGLRVFDQSFEEFAHRGDLPDFDVIALHGVWSWISEDARQAVLTLIRDKLKPGGIAYISYNCLPGWAPIIPIRQLLALYRDSGGGRMAKTEDMIENGLAVVEEIARAGGGYFQANPMAKHHLAEMGKQSKNYIAHEYLNADWLLAHFADTVDSLAEGKLTYVGSARLLDGIDVFNLAPEAVALISQIGDPVMRETIRDYLVNRQFRTDVFIKGSRALSSVEHHNAWGDLLFTIVTPEVDIPKRIRCPRGDVELPEEKYGLIIAAMASDHYRPKSIPELLADAELSTLTFHDVQQMLTVLVGAGYVAPAQNPCEVVKQQCWRLNNSVLSRATTKPELTCLASPVTGGGIQVPHLSQLFILAFRNGAKSKEALACAVKDALEELSDGLLRSGVKMSAEDALNFVQQSAERFLRHDLPLLQALQMFPDI